MSDASRIMRCTISRQNAGGSLISFLSARFPYHTAEEWTRLAEGGTVLLNDAPPDHGRLLMEGDVVRYYPAEKPEAYVDTAVTVLHEDEDIILVDKTGNLPAHPAGKYFKNTLWWILIKRLHVPNPGIINRLDRETSGVTLIAKNPRADRICRRQFSERSITKKYTVFTEGTFQGPAHARGYIVPGSTSIMRKKQMFEHSELAAPEPGRENQWAETGFTLLEKRGGISVLEAIPHTGRLHQIRATLSALGYPVVGDKIYGLDEGVFPRFLEDKMTAEDAARMRMKRQALHASELTFRHPTGGQPMTITAPLPPDMAALLKS